MSYLINVYDAVNKPTVKSTIDVNEWLETIKNPTSKIFQLIETTRLYYPKGSTNYDYVKKSQLPATTFNFHFNRYKEDKNIVDSTGLLFIDVDKPEFDISILNTGKTFSYYKSLSFTGYHILAKVQNLTIENFNDFYKQVCQELNIEKFVDTNAIKKTQFSVASYDPDIFINNDAEPFQYKEEIKTASPINYIREKNTHLGNRGCKIYNNVRYSNIEEIKESLKFDNPYLTDWNGIEIIECQIKKTKVKNGNRKKSLFAYIQNFVILNETLSEQDVLSIAMKVNESMCNEPLMYKEVKEIIETTFKYKDNGTLTPIYTKRKILFENNNLYNKEEKLEIVRSLVYEHKSELSKEKIYSIIENWNFEQFGKITLRSIAKNNSISLKTVTKYYPEFKEYIQTQNKFYKN